MAKDVSNNIRPSLLHINSENKSYLIQIRHWNNLKMATDGTHIWVKGFTDAQLASPVLKSIPFATFYSIRENLLFPEGRLLPEQKLPALLWTPMDKALPITSPDLNHNFFGIHQSISIQLIASAQERPAVAMTTNMETLQRYLPQSSAIRVQTLQWCRINEDKAFIYGTPFLPVEGISYWNCNGLLLPGGFDFDLPILTDIIQQKLNAGRERHILFNTDSSFISIPKDSMKDLSIGSFRLSTANTIS